MNRWRLLIVAASAVAALAVGLTAQASPQGGLQGDDLQLLLSAVGGR